jgi:hypothetical protein
VQQQSKDVDSLTLVSSVDGTKLDSLFREDLVEMCTPKDDK